MERHHRSIEDALKEDIIVAINELSEARRLSVVNRDIIDAIRARERLSVALQRFDKWITRWEQTGRDERGTEWKRKYG